MDRVLKGSTLEEFRFENICDARDNAGTRVEKRGGIDHFPSFEKILVLFNLTPPREKKIQNSIKFDEIIDDISTPCFNNIYIHHR